MKTNHPPFVSARGVFPGATAAVLAVALGFGLAARAGAQTTRKLAGHVPPPAASLAATGRVAPETKMRLSIGLPLRNREALTNLLQELYDPASPSFRHFVSVDEFTRRFGPTPEDYQKVVDFAASRALAVEVKHPNRMLVEVTGRAADVEKAFQVALREYRHPTEDRTFFAPDTEPSVDAGLPILHVAGMDNYVLPRPMIHRTPAGAASPASGSAPGGNYAGIDFRAAYVPGTKLTGTGQSVGLLEYAGYYVSDILAYESNYNLPNVTLSNVVLDGIGSVTDNPGGAEQPLDIEMAISMAPGLNQVIIYYGSYGDDILNRMASDNIAKQLSASWTYGIDDTTLQIFQEFVAQGQNYFNASGDGDAYSAGCATPTDAPYITSVGGTTLSTSGPGGSWTSETTWNWGGTGSSGGVSAHYALPMWQEGVSMTANQGSTTTRNIPDVALTGDGVWVLHDNGGAGSYGGTSCATPLWAAFLALANEQAASNGLPPIGFINPAVYAIGKGTGGSSYASSFHDITTGANTNVASPAKFLAVSGYDLCTGWGTPRGTNLINALAGVGGATNVLLYAAPVALTMTAGGSATVLLTEVAMNTPNSSVSLSASNLPSGVTASFNPAGTTSTSVLTLSAATNAAAGTVNLTITGTTASATNTATVNLTVLAPAPGATTVSLSSAFNITGIYPDGTRFNGGLDGSGNAFSGTLLPGALSFNGCVFTLGGASRADAVKCGGQYVTLPGGQYSALNLLATAVNGNQAGQRFVVNYTDGTSSTFIQSVSDWAVTTGYPGQTVVSFMGYNDTGGGGQGKTTSASLYGYSFALNPNKTVKTIKLPVNSSVMVLGLALANDFSLYPSPFAPALTAGGKEVVQFNAQPLNGLAGNIALSITNLSKGLTPAFNPSSTASTSLLTLVAAAAATPSNSQVMVSGTLGGVTHAVTLGLGVLAATPGATTASLSSAFNSVGLSTDGATFNPAGMDGNGNCYSSTALGTGPTWNGSVFSPGLANGSSAVQCSNQTVSLPSGQFPVLLMLGTAVNSSQPGQTFTVNYTDGSSSTFTQSLSAWTAANNYAGEAVAASMTYRNTSAGTKNTNSPVNLYAYAFSLDDTKTVKSLILPGNTNVVVLALSLANAPWSVSLASAFNAVGAVVDGTTFSGGADSVGNAYSSNLLGASPIWNSTPFHLGPANGANIVRCAGQTISLPPERETQLYLLASAVNANESSQTFTVTYTNGTTSVFTQSLSDWTTSENYAGESVVATMPYRDGSTGAANNIPVNLYGYRFTLDNTRVAKSLTLPNNSDVIVLAVTVKNGPVPMSLASAYNRAGIYTDGTSFTNGGTDGNGNAYSANLLGSNQFWNNMFFGYGPANATNVVSCTGQTLTLPTGQFSSLSLLAAGVDGNQTSQSFKVTYTNAATTTPSLSFSDWVVPTAYAGQTTVIGMPYHDSSGGGYNNSEANVFGYTFAVINAYVAQSITLPNNPDVVILAITLSNATLALTEAPAITAPPQNLTVTNGGPAAFSVSAIGTPALSYRWQFNGNYLQDGGGILGSGASNLTLNPATTNDAGFYTVVVSNSYGSVTSRTATLIVLAPPTIISEPVPLIVTNGSPAVFSISALGTAPLNYQWQWNGSILVDGGEISGAETNALTLSETTTNDAGSYTVVISNLYGSATSIVATLTVLAPPMITSEPVPQISVTSGSPASFSVVAGGTAPLSYQWQLDSNNLADGGEISGSSTCRLTLNPATAKDAGIYSVVVSNTVGSVTSSPAALTVLVPAMIVSQPVPLTVTNGLPAVFSVGAAGTPPLVYQWQFNGNNLADGGGISGSSAGSLTLGATTTNNAGNYTVVVSNMAGCVTSSPAALTVLVPAANITLNYNGGAGSGSQIMQNSNDWNSIGYWWGGTQDGGLPASTLASEFPGAPFIVPPGSLLCTPAGAAAAIFPGAELDLDGDGNFVNGNPGGNGNASSLTTTSAIDLQGGANAGSTNAYELYFTNLAVNGGQIDAGADGVATLDGAMTIGPSNACFYMDTNMTSDSGLQVNSVLSGAGTIQLFLYSYYSNFQTSFSNDLDIAGVNNPFTGAWLVTQGPLLGGGSNSLGTNSITVGPNGALETLYSVNNTNASLALNGMMYLDQSDTFQSVTVNGASLYAGTYTAAQLSSAYPSNFPAAWNQLYGSTNSTASGVLTVLQPPPPQVTLNFTFAAGSLTLTWSQGTLLQAANLLGPWVTNAAATSPYVVAPTNAQMYFQVVNPLLP